MRDTPASSTFGAEFRATLRLAAPLALANLLQMAVFAIDVIFVARLGQEALAASSLAVALFGIIMFGLSGMTAAVAPLIAAELGRRRHAVREVRRSVRMALWLAVLSSLAGIAVCLMGERIIRLTGQDPTLSRLAGEFIGLLALAVMPMVVSNVLRNFVAAIGRPGIATGITALAIAANALGNWMLVFGNLGAPRLGLMGSAWANVITAAVMVVTYVVVIQSDRRLRRFHVFGRCWRPDWERLGDILRIGLPIGLTVVAEAGLFSGAAFLIGRIGEVELAAHAVAMQVAAFFFQVPFGVSQAATIRVGYHFGARDRVGIGRAASAALAIGIGFSVISASAMLFAPRWILAAYVDVTAAENAMMILLAAQYLAIAAAFQFVDAVQAVVAGSLRGLQDTRVPMLIAVSGYWLCGFVAAGALGLATPLEGVGVWIGLALGLVLVAGLLMWRWSRRERIGLLPGAAFSFSQRLDDSEPADHIAAAGTLR